MASLWLSGENWWLFCCGGSLGIVVTERPFVSRRDRRQTTTAAATTCALVAMNISNPKINWLYQNILSVSPPHHPNGAFILSLSCFYCRSAMVAPQIVLAHIELYLHLLGYGTTCTWQWRPSFQEALDSVNYSSIRFSAVKFCFSPRASTRCPAWNIITIFKSQTGFQSSKTKTERCDKSMDEKLRQIKFREKGDWVEINRCRVTRSR